MRQTREAGRVPALWGEEPLLTCKSSIYPLDIEGTVGDFEKVGPMGGAKRKILPEVL